MSNAHEFGPGATKCTKHARATVTFKLRIIDSIGDVPGVYRNHTEEFKGHLTLPVMGGGTLEVCAGQRADGFAAQIAVSGFTDRSNEELGEVRHFMLHEISDLRVWTYSAEEPS